MRIVEELASATSPENDLEGLTRALLRVVGEATGLDSTYLTRIDWEADEQEILFSRNVGNIDIAEGLRVGWSDTLCRRALESGIPCTSDVPGVWGDSGAARDLGLKTYVSFPITGPDGGIFGTFCGASGERKEVDKDGVELLRLCARLVGAHLAREKLLVEESRRAQELEQRLKSRAEFLATAEHELKTPLTVVLGVTQMLERRWTDLEDGQRENYVTLLASSVERLRAQVDRMLETARTEVLGPALDIKPIAARKEVASAVEGFALSARTHPVVMEWEAGDVAVVADANALYQVIGHLIENAMKHADPGEIHVHAAAHGDVFELAVEDAGPGLPPGLDVFAAFQRGNSGRGGVGLGLHIVRSLTEAMGGTVDARNSAERGARFTVSLPVSRERTSEI